MNWVLHHFVAAISLPSNTFFLTYILSDFDVTDPAFF